MTELCSTASSAREEPLAATASRVERWLLVEHRGAWGPQSVPTSRMPHAVARSLAQTAAAAGARLLMIRRPAVRRVTGSGRQVFAVDSAPGRERIRTRHVDADSDLGRLAWDGEGWADDDAPLLLVCTHGRHDRCCALRGRPVAQALSQVHPERTWESSHVGGDRFAANLVVLPDGLYLGRVSADDVVAMVDDLLDGRLPPAHVRGRSSLPLPVQAAQQFAREALGRWRADELVPVEQTGAGRDTWRVRFSDPAAEVVVRYDRAGSGERHRLTCDSPEAKHVPVFRQVSLRRL